MGCSNLQTKPPILDVAIYAGNPAIVGISRKQAGQSILAADPIFSKYSCVSNEDFKRLIQTYVLGCKFWRDSEDYNQISELLKYLPQ